jgi:hypothetical protein
MASRSRQRQRQQQAAQLRAVLQRQHAARAYARVCLRPGLLVEECNSLDTVRGQQALRASSAHTHTSLLDDTRTRAVTGRQRERDHLPPEAGRGRGC